MKITKQELKQLIREQLEEASGQSLKDKIMDLIMNDPEGLDVINANFFQDLAKNALSARRKKLMAAKGPMSPEKKADIAAKAKATRDANKQRDIARANKERNAKEDTLPMHLDDYSGIPNPLYYVRAGFDPKSGLGDYRLKPKFIGVPGLRDKVELYISKDHDKEPFMR